MPEDQTQMITREDVEESSVPSSSEGKTAKFLDSHILRLSVRAIICLELITTVCVLSYIGKEIKEPLYTLATMAAGFYLGQMKPQKSIEPAVKPV
jgi:hypothetical protein